MLDKYINSFEGAGYTRKAVCQTLRLPFMAVVFWPFSKFAATCTNESPEAFLSYSVQQSIRSIVLQSKTFAVGRMDYLITVSSPLGHF